MFKQNLTQMFLLTLFVVLTFVSQAQTLEPMLMTTMQAPVGNLLISPLPMPTISTQQPNILGSMCPINQVNSSQGICIKPQYIEGCGQYQTATTCFKCWQGYTLTTNKSCNYQPSATVALPHIVGCIVQWGTSCNNCASSFYLKDGKCLLGIKNCLNYNADGTCIQCEQDFSLILSQCRRNNILGCKYQTESHTCTQCYAPFTLSGQHCDVDDCRILNDYGCVSCECGYYLTVQRNCKPIAPGCLRYEKGLCKDCLPHYKLKGGVCEIQGCAEYSGNYCKRCGDKYDLIDGECNFKNCIDWLNDQCLACKQGYAVKNGICVTASQLHCQ